MVGTFIMPIPRARASPFAVAAPILNPVNEPGPPVIAIAYKSFLLPPVILNISSIIGSNVCE